MNNKKLKDLLSLLIIIACIQIIGLVIFYPSGDGNYDCPHSGPDLSTYKGE